VCEALQGVYYWVFSREDPGGKKILFHVITFGEVIDFVFYYQIQNIK